MIRWIRRAFGIYGSMACRSCGYRVPYLGDRREQAERALTHYQTLH